MSFTHHDHHHGHVHHDDDRSLTILYATETGNAQDTADRIAAHLRSIHMNCRSHDIGEYPLEDILSEPLVIFVVSTTGSGTEPRDATPLMDSLLRSDLPSDLFDELHYAVFGLGDSSYEKFCWPAKVLDRRLEGLGARRICERGDADDQHALGIDGALDPWLATLTTSLLTLLPLPPSLHPLPASSLPPARVKLIDVSETHSNLLLTAFETGPSNEPAPEASASHSYPANNLSGVSDTSVAENNASRNYHRVKVLKNERITADGWWQDVRHFEFESEDELRYEPGDVAVIHPEASSSDVDAFLACMGWEDEADRPFWVVHEMKDQSLPSSLSLPLNEHISHLPQSTSTPLTPPPISAAVPPHPSSIPSPPNATTHRPPTLRQLVTRHLDINAVPRRGFFRLLRHFTEDEREIERLDELGEANELGANDLYDYATRPRRTIREVMEEFRGVKGRMPRQYVFEMLPPLRPRMFSIASDVETHPKEVHLCVAIVQYKTKLKIPRRGVCTSYLSSLKSGTTLLLGLQKGLLSLPPSPSIPIICVGPGTGIAPMRALIERRVRQGARDNKLYFGCRSQDMDQHYGQEWERLSRPSVSSVDNPSTDPAMGNSKPYLTYRPAFSRDNPEGVKRTYVQDLMDEDREKVWDVVGRRGGWVYISGSANKMPAAVRKSIADTARLCGRLGEDEAKEYVERMGREGRLWEECWS